MRIAIITQWFDPEGGSAAIPGAIARALRDRGHQIDVVTGFPNYPGGDLYAGYRVRPYQRESASGVTIHRVPLYPSHDSSAVRRILNFGSFMVSASTLGSLIARRSDVTLVYSTPGTVGMAGLVLRRVLRRPFVLYIQDLWPDTLTATGMLPRRLARASEWILHRFSNAVYRAANHIAVTSPGMKPLLLARGVPDEKVSVIFDWVDEAVFREIKRNGRHGGPFEVMYAGNVGPVQGLDTLIRAVQVASDEVDILLRIVGSGIAIEDLRQLAAELGVDDRVHFEGTVPLEGIAEVIASADLQIVSLKDDPLFRLTMPSKLQAILACGRPVLTSAPGDAAAITDASGAGWSVPPEDVGALAEAIVQFARLPEEELAARGRAGRAFYEEVLSSSVGSELLAVALSSAMEDDRNA